jgi:predicted dehydrogenase
MKMSEAFGIPRVYDCVNQMLQNERPDIVDICTPPDTHTAVARDALGMGSHCILEKPMTVTLGDADELIRMSKQKDLRIFVLHNYSFVPCIRKARRAMQSGKLGKVVLVETRYFTSLRRERYYDSNHWIHKLPGGILNSELLPHLLMLILDFVDAPIAECKVVTNKRSDLPYVRADELRIFMTTSDKTMGYVGLSFNSPVLSHTLDVIGERGGLFVDHTTQAVVYHKAPASDLPTDRETTSAISRGTWAINEILQKSAGFVSAAANTALGRYKMQAEGHRFLLRECLRTLDGKTQYPVDLQKCREVVKLMENVYRSV